MKLKEVAKYILEGASIMGKDMSTEESFKMYDEFTRDAVKYEQDSLDYILKKIEEKFAKKYRHADLISVYSMAEKYSSKFKPEPKDITYAFMEPFFKASHNHNIKVMKEIMNMYKRRRVVFYDPKANKLVLQKKRNGCRLIRIGQL